MVSYGNPLIDWVKEHTSFLLEPFAKVLHKSGLHPHVATILSFCAGMLAAFFLFHDQTLFIIFGISHFVLDLFDGAVARAAKKTSSFGRWFDYATDRSVTVMLLLKCLFFFQNQLIIGILVLYILHNLIYVLHKGSIILFYSRTVLLFSLILGYAWFGLLFTALSSGIGILAQLLMMAERYHTKMRS